MFLSKYGKYYYVYYRNPLTGKMTKVTTKCQKKTGAYKFLQTFTESRMPKPRNVTFKEFREEILKYAKFHYAEKTIEIYTRPLDLFEKMLGNILMKYITQNQIERYKDYRITSGVSKTTVNMDFRALKAMFNIAIQWGIIDKNPCYGVKQYSIPQKEILAFTEPEIERILHAAPEGYIKDSIMFALNTGCRLREITNFQWRDIDAENKILYVRNKENFKTKTGKMRSIPISTKLNDVITKLRARNQYMNPEEYLFHRYPGIVYDGNLISKKFKDLIRSLGFPLRYHFHCLRHTFITQLARKGVNIYDIKQLAGHSDIKTTELYMHNITDDLRRAVELI